MSSFAAGDGRLLGTFGFKQLVDPADLCVAEDGRVIVADQTNVMVYAGNGTLIGSFAAQQPGDTITPRLKIIACSVDGSRAVFVGDGPSLTVRKFLQSMQPTEVAAKQSLAAAVVLSRAGMASPAPPERGEQQAVAAAAAAAKGAALAGVSAAASLAHMQARLAAFAAHVTALPLSGLQLERLADMADRHDSLLNTFQEELTL